MTMLLDNHVAAERHECDLPQTPVDPVSPPDRRTRVLNELRDILRVDAGALARTVPEAKSIKVALNISQWSPDMEAASGSSWYVWVSMPDGSYESATGETILLATETLRKQIDKANRDAADRAAFEAWKLREAGRKA